MSIGPIVGEDPLARLLRTSPGTPMSALNVQACRPRARISSAVGVERLLGATGDDDIRAGVRQRERHDAAEAAARAGDERPLAVQPEQVKRAHPALS